MASTTKFSVPAVKHAHHSPQDSPAGHHSTHSSNTKQSQSSVSTSRPSHHTQIDSDDEPLMSSSQKPRRTAEQQRTGFAGSDSSSAKQSQSPSSHVRHPTAGQHISRSTVVHKSGETRGVAQSPIRLVIHKPRSDKVNDLERPTHRALPHKDNNNNSGTSAEAHSSERKIDSGVWVQCCRPPCLKWRYLVNISDPCDVPDNWDCSMNDDPYHCLCTQPEQYYDHNTEDFIYCRFTEGSLVWAKMTSYPWWPAMVQCDPDLGTYFDCTEQQHVVSDYHVVFLDERMSRAWLPADKVRPFTGNEQLDKMAEPGKYARDYRRLMHDAMNRARHAKQLDVQKRLKVYGFKVDTAGANTQRGAANRKKSVVRKSAPTERKPRKRATKAESSSSSEGLEPLSGRNSVSRSESDLEMEGKERGKVPRKRSRKEENEAPKRQKKSHERHEVLSKVIEIDDDETGDSDAAEVLVVEVEKMRGVSECGAKRSPSSVEQAMGDGKNVVETVKIQLEDKSEEGKGTDEEIDIVIGGDETQELQSAEKMKVVDGKSGEKKIVNRKKLRAEDGRGAGGDSGEGSKKRKKECKVSSESGEQETLKPAKTKKRSPVKSESGDVDSCPEDERNVTDGGSKAEEKSGIAPVIGHKESAGNRSELKGKVKKLQPEKSEKKARDQQNGTDETVAMDVVENILEKVVVMVGELEMEKTENGVEVEQKSEKEKTSKPRPKAEKSPKEKAEKPTKEKKEKIIKKKALENEQRTAEDEQVVKRNEVEENITIESGKPGTGDAEEAMEKKVESSRAKVVKPKKDIVAKPKAEKPKKETKEKLDAEKVVKPVKPRLPKPKNKSQTNLVEELEGKSEVDEGQELGEYCREDMTELPGHEEPQKVEVKMIGKGLDCDGDDEASETDDDVPERLAHQLQLARKSPREGTVSCQEHEEPLLAYLAGADDNDDGKGLEEEPTSTARENVSPFCGGAAGDWVVAAGSQSPAMSLTPISSPVKSRAMEGCELGSQVKDSPKDIILPKILEKKMVPVFGKKTLGIKKA